MTTERGRNYIFVVASLSLQLIRRELRWADVARNYLRRQIKNVVANNLMVLHVIAKNIFKFVNLIFNLTKKINLTSIVTKFFKFFFIFY